MTAAPPDWAIGMTDLHAHAAPSLLPRHGDDAATVASERAVGFETIVLKAHEGSTAERATIAGPGVHGGIVLNSPVGGGNPDAVEVAARLGARVVWLPTASSRTHQAARASADLAVHRAIELSPVDVVDEAGRLPVNWLDVLDVVVAHDLLLCSGHLSAREVVVVFAEAHRRGVRRLLVNHPLMAFLGWDDEAGAALRGLGVHLELGILPDLIGDAEHASLRLIGRYPHELLAFGADLGHAEYPTPAAAVGPWLRTLEACVGATVARAIVTHQSRQLLGP